MSIVIFLGPTLSLDEARRELDAEFLAPVAQGDVYRAARKKPRAIGIVDGYFDRVPSVWHKEILWALSQGIYVFGAASLGALRASELASFGMIGVGQVFKDFHDGVLEDDDEVAIVHASREDGYRPLSVAMVDIRATVAGALEAGALNERAAQLLVDIAKDLPYPERNYRYLLVSARAAGLDLGEFESFVADHCVNRKRRDAISLLRVMKAFLGEALPPHHATFTFEHTDAFEDARSRVDSELVSPLNAQQDSSLLNEVCLSGDWQRTHDGALLRALVMHGPGAPLFGAIEPRRAEEEFRIAKDLSNQDDFATWRAEQDLDDERLVRFFVEEAVMRTVALAFRSELLREVPDFLRAAGRLRSISARAQEKDALSSVSLAQLGIDNELLFDWYFSEVRVMPRPQSLEHYAHRTGFVDLAAFRRAVLGEFRLQQTSGTLRLQHVVRGSADI